MAQITSKDYSEYLFTTSNPNPFSFLGCNHRLFHFPVCVFDRVKCTLDCTLEFVSGVICLVSMIGLITFGSLTPPVSEMIEFEYHDTLKNRPECVANVSSENFKDLPMACLNEYIAYKMDSVKIANKYNRMLEIKLNELNKGE